MRVTTFESVIKTDNPYHIPLQTALDRIKGEKHKQTIDSIRSGNKELKKTLPIVLFSGEFMSRKDEDLFEHSGFIVLDFDKLHVGSVKPLLATDQYVYSVWVSPSGNGLKALVRITNPERHRDHFRALVQYFSKQYSLEVDPTGINESRACFESHDPDIIINPGSNKFGAFLSERAEEQTVVSKSDGFTDYMKLNLAARMIRNAEEGQKHIMLLKASTLCGGFISAGRIEEEEAIRVLSREILKKDNVNSEEEAIATIHRGIEKGKTMPIHDILRDEKDIKREMLINDGDMSFISSDDEDFNWINDFADGKIKPGLTTGHAEFDKNFRYKKNFLIINGHSNVGKTTTALAMMVNASVRHDWVWAVYSAENKTASIKLKIMEFAFQRRARSMNVMQRRFAYEWVNRHFIVITNREVYSYYDMVIFAEKTMKYRQIDGFFIDPYNSLRIKVDGNSGLSTHEYHYEAASEFLTFSNANNIAVWLNMHAVTEAQRRKGDDGLPVAPFAEDTEGGGKFVNRADDFVTIHRKVQAEDHLTRGITEWHVRKVRETETGGEPTPWDKPMKLSINTDKTGFVIKDTGIKLFEPLVVPSESNNSLNAFNNERG